VIRHTVRKRMLAKLREVKTETAAAHAFSRSRRRQMAQISRGRAYPILRRSLQSVCAGQLSLFRGRVSASRSSATKPERARSLGANETADYTLAASSPHLPSLSFAPCARHHLRQEPCAGNLPVRICAGVRSKPYPYRDPPLPMP
jgi:hypothetical protein